MQKQKEMNTSPSVCNPTVAPPWYPFGMKWVLSVNVFHCYLNAMMWSWKRTSLTRIWWWPLKNKTVSFPHAWNITSYWCYFFSLPFLLDEVTTYSRSKAKVVWDTYHLLKATTEFTLHADSPAVVFLKNAATHMVFFNIILLYMSRWCLFL